MCLVVESRFATYRGALRRYMSHRECVGAYIGKVCPIGARAVARNTGRKYIEGALPPQHGTLHCVCGVENKEKDPHANMVVTPSDHFVTDVAEFRRIISSSLNFVADSDAILTLGIKPTRPDTGYGYIEAALGTASLANKEVFRVDSFKEKPALETAKAYIAKNNFYWNAGIFIWNVSTIVNAFRVYQGPIAEIFESLTPITSQTRSRLW